VGDVGRADEDGVDAGAFEREHLLARGRRQVGDRELAAGTSGSRSRIARRGSRRRRPPAARAGRSRDRSARASRRATPRRGRPTTISSPSSWRARCSSSRCSSSSCPRPRSGTRRRRRRSRLGRGVDAEQDRQTGASRRSGAGPLTASPSAPCSSAARAVSGSATSAMIDDSVSFGGSPGEAAAAMSLTRDATA
jgi:hypothetical protein